MAVGGYGSGRKEAGAGGQVEQRGCWTVIEAAPQITAFSVSPEGTGFWDDCGTGGLLHSTLPNLRCPHNSQDTSLSAKAQLMNDRNNSCFLRFNAVQNQLQMQ